MPRTQCKAGPAAPWVFLESGFHTSELQQAAAIFLPPGTSGSMAFLSSKNT